MELGQRGHPTVDREKDFKKYRGMTADEVELEEETTGRGVPILG